MRQRWIVKHRDDKTHFIPESEYRAEDWEVPVKRIVPDWVSDEPVRGKWAFRVVDGVRKLTPITDEPSPVFHFVHQDTMDAIENPADGNLYDSKSAYMRAVKDAGLEVLGKQSHRIGLHAKRAMEELARTRKEDIIKVLECSKSPEAWHDMVGRARELEAMSIEE